MNEDKNGVARWDLHGVTLTHFDGNKRPLPVLKAVNKWLKETNVAPNHIHLNCVFNTESQQYEYVATVEWDSRFVI